MKMRNHLTRRLNYTLIVILSVILALLPARLLTSPHDPNEAGRPSPARSGHPGSGTVAAMRARVLAARPLALYYTLGDTTGLDSILQHASDITVLAPQCYWVGMDGNIHGALPPEMMEAARRKDLPVMALLSNQDFSRQVASTLLRNHHLAKLVVRSLAIIALRENLLGFQLDFENIDPRDENLYTRFVREVAKELHHEGRLLSVAVIPRFLGSHANQWSAAYDYPALASASDFLTLMTYDNSGRLGPPGPIAGYAWVKDAIEYARRRTPANKLLLGIALYGREWSEEGGSFQARTMPYPDTEALLDRLSLKPHWDQKQRSPWFEYRTSGILRSVWYENARSIQEKLRLLEQFRLRGFAAWRLGMEDPRIWSLVSAMEERSPEAASGPATGF